VYVETLIAHWPAVVKSFLLRLLVVEWHAEHELTSGTVGLGAHAANTALAILPVAAAC
jgi:hypothetical protein